MSRTTNAPAIADLAAADAALLELARLDAKEAAINESCDQEIAATKARHAKRLVTVIDKVHSLPIAERRAQLQADLEAFADQHRATLFPDDRKSLDLNHGTLGWRRTPDGVEFVEGADKKSVIAEFAGRIVAKLQDVLGDLRLGFGRLSSRIFHVKLDLDLKSIAKLHADGELSAEQLGKLSLEPRPGSDAFFARPHKVALVETQDD